MGDGTAYDYRDNTPSRDMHATSSYEAPNQQLSQHEQPSQIVVPSILSQQAGEPWLAAQNLAFLKRGSPASELKRPALFKLKSSSGDIASMPSLASSSDGTSPGDGVASKYSALEEDESGADALLMAAVAMTEFGQSPPPRLQYLDSIATRSTPDSIIGTEPRSELPCSPEASHVRHYHPDFYQRSDDSNVESRRHSPPSKRSLDFDNVIQHQTGKRSKEEDS